MRAVLPSRCLLFFAIAVAGCAADLSTKAWIFDRLGILNGRTWWMWEDRIGFQTSLNEGALFGMGQGGVPVFVALSALACIGILIWFFRGGAASSLLITIALGCITAGILGNLYDRLGMHGMKWPPGCPPHQAGDLVHAVRDWIRVMIFGHTWPNFNIADSLLVSGATLLIWHAWRGEEKEKDEGSKAKDNG
jgi:signal peptidase II